MTRLACVWTCPFKIHVNLWIILIVSSLVIIGRILVCYLSTSSFSKSSFMHSAIPFSGSAYIISVDCFHHDVYQWSTDLHILCKVRFPPSLTLEDGVIWEGWINRVAKFVKISHVGWINCISMAKKCRRLDRNPSAHVIHGWYLSIDCGLLQTCFGV